MLLTVWAGSECLWRGEAPDSVMGVRPGDELDVPGWFPEDGRMTVLRRHVSLAGPGERESQMMLRLEVSVG